MHYTHKLLPNALIVTIDGELDMHTAPPFREYMDNLLAANPQVKHLLLDIAKTQFIDSSGLGVILGRYKDIHQRGGKLIFLKSPPQISRVLRISGFQKIAEFADSSRDAMERL